MSSDSSKLNLKGNPDTNVYVSLMAQFSKGTYFFKLSRSKSKTPIIIIFIYCAKVFKVLVNIVLILEISLRVQVLGLLALADWYASLFGVHNAELNIYKSIAHRVPNKIIFSLLPILMQHCSL